MTVTEAAILGLASETAGGHELLRTRIRMMWVERQSDGRALTILTRCGKTLGAGLVSPDRDPEIYRTRVPTSLGCLEGLLRSIDL